MTRRTAPARGWPVARRWSASRGRLISCSCCTGRDEPSSTTWISDAVKSPTSWPDGVDGHHVEHHQLGADLKHQRALLRHASRRQRVAAASEQPVYPANGWNRRMSILIFACRSPSPVEARRFAGLAKATYLAGLRVGLDEVASCSSTPSGPCSPSRLSSSILRKSVGAVSAWIEM